MIWTWNMNEVIYESEEKRNIKVRHGTIRWLWGCTQWSPTQGQAVTYLRKDSITESLYCCCLSSLWEATVEVGSMHFSQRLLAARPISSWVVCLSPSDDEMLCWEAAQFIKHTVVSGLLSLPALTASQCLFTSRKYDRLYVYLTVCLCECACAEVTEEVVCLRGGGCVWGCICGALQEVDTCAIYAIQCKNSAKTPQASSKKFNQQFCDSVNEN